MEKVKQFSFFFVLVLVALTGCKSGMGMSASGSPAKYLETFYKGEGKDLYYVKPFDWKAESGTGFLRIDLTYNYDKDTLRPLVANFSYFSEEPANQIENVVLNLPKGDQKFIEIEKIYVEKSEQYKKYYHNRHTFPMEYDQFKAWMQVKEPVLKLTANGAVHTFSEPKKWKKRTAHLQTYMIQTIELNK